MKKSIFNIILFLLIANSSYALNPVGAIKGSASVGANGAAIYEVPIYIPQGTAGMQPSLSIGYNSLRGNSLMGMGWDLQGISMISRGPQTIYHNNNVQEVQIGSFDWYMLDGNRLIPVAGSNGGNGTEYRTESEAFSAIYSYGIQANGPAYFEVNTKDGKIIEYGKTIDSRDPTIGSTASLDVFAWRINKVTDANGNYMEYEYNQVNGECTIKSIRYTGNVSLPTVLSPYYAINFSYGAKPDANTGFTRGCSDTQSSLLTEIQIIYIPTGDLIRKYQFTYTQDFYSHLFKIKYFGEGGVSELNATTINWYPEVTNTSTPTPTNISNSDDMQYFAGDFNGDGLSDVVKFIYRSLATDHYTTTDYFQVWITATDGSQSMAYSANFAYDHFRNDEFGIADIDGDGRDELIICYRNWTNQTNDYYIMSFNGNSLTPIASFAEGYCNMVAGDFTGDGRADIFLRIATTTWKIMGYQGYNLGASFGTIASGQNPSGGSPFLFTWPGVNETFLDFDGDGKTDIMITEPAAGNHRVFEYDPATQTLEVIFAQNGATMTLTTFHRIFPGDFNGDGKGDLIAFNTNSNQWELIYSDGLNFINSPGTLPGLQAVDPSDFPQNNAAKILVADFNGDGKDDILSLSYFTSGIWLVEFNYAKGFGLPFEYENFYVSFCTDNGIETLSYGNLALGDFNGDGKLDFLTGKKTCNSSILYHRIDEKRHLVQNITDGYGVVNEFNYRTLTNTLASTPIYTKHSNAAFPVSDYQGGYFHVVSDHTANYGNFYYKDEYLYEGALLHRQGKGLLGFKKLHMYSYYCEPADMPVLVNEQVTEITHPGPRYNPQITVIQKLVNSSLASQVEYIYNTVSTPAACPSGATGYFTNATMERIN